MTTENTDENTSSAQGPTREMPAQEHTVIIEVPRELGTYRLTKLLGRGGMGEVWQAFDISLERDVAIKLMRKELYENEDATRRFAREARAVARLNHSNIVQVYAFGDEKGLNYFVMELVDGETVSQYLKRKKQLPLNETLHIIMQSIEGLGYANARGIIHRDIKPSNLMLTDDARVKIADFGLAKMIEHDTQMTAAGTAMGSPNYMSPEQARGEEADHRSDIYALGISMFQMLCGDLPFTANSPVSVLLKQIQDPLPEHELIKCINDGAVLSVIKKMTEKRPQDRYQSYSEVAAALASLQPGLNFRGAHLQTATMAAADSGSTVSPPDGFDRSADLSRVNTEQPIPVTPPPPSETFKPLPEDRPAPPPEPFTESAYKDPLRRGFLIASFAAILLGVVAIGAWYAFSTRNVNKPAVDGTETATVSTPVPLKPAPGAPEALNSPSATSTPTTAATPTPTPSQTPAPNITPYPSVVTGNSTTIVSTPATGMQPVEVEALLTPRPTPLVGVPGSATPTPDFSKLLPSGLSAAPVNTTPAKVTYVLGMQGNPSASIPSYIEATGRTLYKQLPAGTEVTLVSDTGTMLRVLIPNDPRPVFIYKKMAQPKP